MRKDTWRQRKIKLQVVLGTILQVHQLSPKLEDVLEYIVTWAESENRMKGRDIAPTSAETEKVGITIRGKSPEFRVCPAELLFVSWKMGTKPGNVKSLDTRGRHRSNKVRAIYWLASYFWKTQSTRT